MLKKIKKRRRDRKNPKHDILVFIFADDRCKRHKNAWHDNVVPLALRTSCARTYQVEGVGEKERWTSYQRKDLGVGSAHEISAMAQWNKHAKAR